MGVGDVAVTSAPSSDPFSDAPVPARNAWVDRAAPDPALWPCRLPEPRPPFKVPIPASVPLLVS